MHRDNRRSRLLDAVDEKGDQRDVIVRNLYA